MDVSLDRSDGKSRRLCLTSRGVCGSHCQSHRRPSSRVRRAAAAVHRSCGDVFKFTRLCFPSDSSGQFNADDHLAKPKANNMDLELGPSQRKSAASAS